MPLKIEAAGQETILQRLGAIRRRLGDLTPIMREISGELHASVEDNFHWQESAQNEPWKRWSEGYREWRGDHGYLPGSILVLHGHLVNSIQAGWSNTAAWVGTNRRYAGRQQADRPFLGLRDERRESILQRLGSYVTGE